MAGVNGDRKGKKDDSGLGSAIDFMLSNAKLVLGVGGAAMLGIATLAVKRVRVCVFYSVPIFYRFPFLIWQTRSPHTTYSRVSPVPYVLSVTWSICFYTQPGSASSYFWPFRPLRVSTSRSGVEIQPVSHQRVFFVSDVWPSPQRSVQPHQSQPIREEELGGAELAGVLATDAEPRHEAECQSITADAPHVLQLLPVR